MNRRDGSSLLGILVGIVLVIIVLVSVASCKSDGGGSYYPHDTTHGYYDSHHHYHYYPKYGSGRVKPAPRPNYKPKAPSYKKPSYGGSKRR